VSHAVNSDPNGPTMGAVPLAPRARDSRLTEGQLYAGCTAFLVAMSLAIVGLLVAKPGPTYPGGDGSSDCLVSGYPTNVDSCPLDK